MPVNNSPNMTLPVPVVGVEPGPQYASDVNSCLNTIDSHDHSVGKGVPITPNGMSITADLSFGGNNVTQARSVRFNTLGSVSGASDVGCLYESGVDLFYNDGNGTAIRITSGGAITGTPGSIAGLVSPASATYSAPTFVFQSGVNIAANVDGRNFIYRNATAGSKGLTLQPPAAMGADYNLILPALPGAQTFIGLDSAGNITSVASVSLGITNSMLNGNIRTTKIFTGDQVAIQTRKITSASALTTPDGLILCDSSGGAYNVIMQDTSGGVMNGYTVVLKKTTSDFNTITVIGSGSQQIDLASSTNLNTQEEALTLVCNSDGNWNIQDRSYPENWASTSFTASGGISLHGGAAQASFSRRVGDSLQCRVYFQSVDTTAATATITLPNSLTIDTTKLNNSGSVLGMAWMLTSNTYFTSDGVPGGLIWAVCFNSAVSTTAVYLANKGTTSAFSQVNFNSIFGSNVTGIAAEFTVPITGWN